MRFSGGLSIPSSYNAKALRCEECGALAWRTARGWQGHVAYDPREDEAPYTVFYCPACAQREFGLTEAEATD
jgi:predicted RNA-binding Zn-ribbon protein involved in translation (DUF1610 family)